MRPISGIIIHCTATRPAWWQSRSTAQKVAEIKRWHVEDRGWSDIGYHYLIDRNGKVAEGRPLSRTGAHVRGHNKGTIGISLFGGHGSSETDQFQDNFTAEQEAALVGLILKLKKDYPAATISGHNQYAAKACPGFNAKAWWNQAMRKASEVAAEPAPQPTPPKPKPKGLLALLIALFTGGRK